MGFLRRGLITAILKDRGTYPDDNDRLTVFSNVLSKILVVGLEHEIILVS